jgi:hypothetical protein
MGQCPHIPLTLKSLSEYDSSGNPTKNVGQIIEKCADSKANKLIN